MLIRKIPCIVVPPNAPEPKYPTENGLYIAIGWCNYPENLLSKTATFPWDIICSSVTDGEFTEWQGGWDPANVLVRYPDIKLVYLLDLSDSCRKILDERLGRKDIQLVEQAPVT